MGVSVEIHCLESILYSEYSLTCFHLMERKDPDD